MTGNSFGESNRERKCEEREEEVENERKSLLMAASIFCVKKLSQFNALCVLIFFFEKKPLIVVFSPFHLSLGWLLFYSLSTH
jgi:hypothetical protein